MESDHRVVAGRRGAGVPGGGLRPMACLVFASLLAGCAVQPPAAPDPAPAPPAPDAPSDDEEEDEDEWKAITG